MKPVRFHSAVAQALERLDVGTSASLADLFVLLAAGESLGMPVSRPMPSVAHGAHELRIRDRSGKLRIFYYTKHREAILVFHMFRKKTRQTPRSEIKTAQRRLKEML